MFIKCVLLSAWDERNNNIAVCTGSALLYLCCVQTSGSSKILADTRTYWSLMATPAAEMFYLFYPHLFSPPRSFNLVL